MPTSKKNKLTRNQKVTIAVAIIGAIATVFAAFIPGAISRLPAPTPAPTATPTPSYTLISTNIPNIPASNPILPTQTNIPTQNPITDTSTASPTITSTASATMTAQQPPPTMESPHVTTTSECRFNNLIRCSIPIAIYDDKTYKSISGVDYDNDGNVLVEFNNQQTGSGVSFQFSSPLDVRGFNLVELIGTSNNAFGFEIEYKVKVGNDVEKVMTSPRKEFPATSDPYTIQIPIVYDGEIVELAINFYQTGQAATFTIGSIRLMPQN